MQAPKEVGEALDLMVAMSTAARERDPELAASLAGAATEKVRFMALCGATYGLAQKTTAEELQDFAVEAARILGG